MVARANTSLLAVDPREGGIESLKHLVVQERENSLRSLVNIFLALEQAGTTHSARNA